MGLKRFLKDPIVIVSFVLLLVAAAVLLVILFYNQKPENVFQSVSDNSSKELNKGETSQGDCDSNPSPVFTADITDVSKISYLTPPVTVQGDDLKTHGYIHLGEDSSKVPVYIPVDAKLYQGAYYEGRGEGLYTIYFEVSCEVIIMFDHIIEPIEKIKKEFSDQPAPDSRTNKIGPIQFKAGELIGHTGGTDNSKNWDFGVYNLYIETITCLYLTS